MANHTTRAQRINARYDKIWDNYDRLQRENGMTADTTRFNATSRNDDTANVCVECRRMTAPADGNICEECAASKRSDRGAATAQTKPWRRFGGMVDGYGIADASGKVIIPQEPFNGLNQHGDEILQAVNSFDALRDALRLAQADLYEGCFADSTASAIETALALAEGKGAR